VMKAIVSGDSPTPHAAEMRKKEKGIPCPPPPVLLGFPDIFGWITWCGRVRSVVTCVAVIESLIFLR
jgi:hypothetical protein